MALLIDCPGCGNQIVNNGQDCPFCGYSVKTGKTREEIEQELLAAEEALRAEEEAKAAEEARKLEEAKRIEEEKRAAEEAARLEQERLAEQTRLAAEEAKRQAQQNSIFGKFQQRNVTRNRQTDLSDKVNNNIENLPEMPSGDDSSLPPMQLDKPVPLSQIANTPAVPLTPLPKEKETTVLPPMQLEREITVEEIRNTPAVPLSPIKNEEVTNALPDINSPEAARPKRSGPEISVEIPVQSAAPSVRKPEIDVQVNVPQQPAKPSVVLQKKEQPPVQQPSAPVQQPRQPRQWSSNPNDFNQQPPVQQQRPPQPMPQQQPIQQPRQQRQWSSNPNDFNQQQPPVQPQQPIQPPVQQQQPPRQPRQPRQWSSNPNDFNQQPPVQPQQPMQPPVQQQRPPQQPVQQQPPRQPRQQRQWSSQPLQPIEQQHTEVTATGERLESLPPQQVPTDPNFDQTSYIKKLKREMYQGKMGGSANNNAEDDILQKAENVEVKPMKFDGKEIKGQRVNVVTAPQTKNTAIVPAIIIIVLILALAVVAYFVLFGNNPLGGSQESSAANIAGTVTFEKPEDWGDTICAYVFIDGTDELSSWPGSSMTKQDDGTYTFVIPEHYKDAYIIFNDGKNKNQYPSKFADEDENIKIDFNTVYKVPANASK